jgi:hypothetical protein
VSYEDATRDELREELKERDLAVSGNKQELIERLEAADRENDQDAEGEEGDEEARHDEHGDGGARERQDGGEGAREGEDADDKARDGGSSSSQKLKPMQLARLAGAQLMQLTGRDLDGSAGIERTDEGWRVLFEVVEVTRVPRAMDVLGLYEVVVDDDGDLVRYERIRRYGRSQPEDEG